MSNSNIFVVKNPPQYGVITSKLEKQNNRFDHTLFPNVYNGCEDSVNKIIEHNKNMDSQNNPDIEPFVNPIVAITGSRGSGKSSAMYSYAQYLRDATISGATFSILPPIDATQFGKNESVIGNISAAMYREYGKISDKLSVDKKREFVQIAKEVNNTAVMYTTGDWFRSGDDLLQDAEKVGSLRKRLHDLIMIYLGLYTDNQPVQNSYQNRYLVIMLDDLDMCNDGAFALVEEIRKFLCIRNVIILMTMQSSQLRTVLQASYAKVFKNVGSEMNSKIQSISFDLAFRSFEKLFPASRCHAMPVWNSEQLKNCDLLIGDEDQKCKAEHEPKASIDFLYEKIEKKENRSKILYRTLHLIWRKTLMIPVCNKHAEHLLIPINLRSLHNFIAMLSGMDDVISIEENAFKTLPALIPGIKEFDKFIQQKFINTEILDKNLSIFENYLLDNLSPCGDSLNNDIPNLKLAQTLHNLILEMHTVPLEQLNAKIVGDILDSELPEYVKFALGKSELEDAKGQQATQEYYILQNAVSHADNISVGDVIYVLGKIDVKTRCRYIAYLIEVIRTIWSIRMTREFYLHCNYDDGFISVSKSFRKAVGGLIVNANTTSFTKNKDKGDWYPIPQSSKDNYYSWFFTAFIENPNLNENEPLLLDKCKNYREHNLNGNPYYENASDSQGLGLSICHPLAYYTNALESDKPNNEQNPTVYFPFYSLDFLYRFYEEFRQQYRKVKSDDVRDLKITFTSFNNTKNDAIKNILETVSYYIPLNNDNHYNQCDVPEHLKQPLKKDKETE